MMVSQSDFELMMLLLTFSSCNMFMLPATAARLTANKLQSCQQVELPAGAGLAVNADAPHCFDRR